MGGFVNMVEGNASLLVLSGDVHGGFGESVENSGDAIGQFMDELDCRRGEDLGVGAGLVEVVSEVKGCVLWVEGVKVDIEGDALAQGFVDLKAESLVDQGISAGEDEGAVVSGIGAMMNQEAEDVGGGQFETFGFIENDDGVDGLKVVEVFVDQVQGSGHAAFGLQSHAGGDELEHVAFFEE